MRKITCIGGDENYVQKVKLFSWLGMGIMRNICSRGFLRKCKIATTIRALQFHNSDLRYIIGKWKNTKSKKKSFKYMKINI